MFKTTLIAGVVSAMALAATAYAAQDESLECTEAHFKQMDTIAAQLTGDRKQAAEKHLQMSKDAFAKGDSQGCLQHMQETHLAMGLSESNKTGAAGGATGGETSGSY